MIRLFFVVIAVCVIVAEFPSMGDRSLRKADTCGVAQTNNLKVAGGENYPRGSFPWVVALMHTGLSPPEYFCGGTLISKSFVITAAHCIADKFTASDLNPTDILAIFGAYDLSNAYETERYQLHPESIVIHADWNRTTFDFDADIALLHFKDEDIYFNSFVQPICLWNPVMEPKEFQSTVAGWPKKKDAQENKLQVVKAAIHTNGYCLPGHGRYAELSSERTYCVALRNTSKYCTGDNGGGGLFVKVDGVFYLKGITATVADSDEPCDNRRKSIYVNLFSFKDWLVQITGTAVALKKIFCTFKVGICDVKQAIDSEDYDLGSPVNSTILRFNIGDNKDLKFLPRNVGDKFPNLESYKAWNSGLTVLRNHNFRNMKKLKFLTLSNNQISTIEAEAFKDLINLEELLLGYNLIQTLDVKVFASMIRMNAIYLDHNKIKSLNPAVFKIRNGHLTEVDLSGNVCIDEWYRRRSQLEVMEADLRARCAGRV